MQGRSLDTAKMIIYPKSQKRDLFENNFKKSQKLFDGGDALISLLYDTLNSATVNSQILLLVL